jgi:hypothetical protein
LLKDKNKDETMALTKIYTHPLAVWISPSDWGGIIGTMYDSFSTNEIDEKIIKLQRRLNKFNYVTNREEIIELAKTFTDEERNYINSPLLDDFCKLEREWETDIPLRGLDAQANRLLPFLESRNLTELRLWVPLIFLPIEDYGLALPVVNRLLFSDRRII